MPSGEKSFIAPMKINFLKTVVGENKRRGVVILSSLVCLILLAFTPGASQLKTQKRITALQLGDAAEGARVTIVSDSALNDYEAFRRGDRFYVKIPLAGFTSIPPSFRADGFEDVQVQKVGDSLLVSFRLQPGASARVDQRSNRLDVIFSAPNRALRNGMANGSSVGLPRNTSDRGADAAGPMPPGTAMAFPRGATTYGAGETYGVREGQNPRLPFNPSAPSANAGRSAGNQSAGSTAIKSPSPVTSPSSILSPSPSTTFPPVTSATPAVPTATSAGSQPALSASPAISSSASSWKVRGDAAMRWMSANRLATLLGALLLLALIFYLLLAIGRRRKKQAKAKRLKAPKVQPKIQPAVEPQIEPIHAAVSNSQPEEFSSTRPSTSSSAPSASSSAVASAQDRTWVLTKPSIISPTAGPGEASSEEQEREVFEL